MLSQNPKLSLPLLNTFRVYELQQRILDMIHPVGEEKTKLEGHDDYKWVINQLQENGYISFPNEIIVLNNLNLILMQ